MINETSEFHTNTDALFRRRADALLHSCAMSAVFLPIVFIIVGFLLLVKGAGWLVDGSSSLAKRLGVSDLAIGLTIVAFGTSTPELIVNIVASFQGNADIAIGNIVGSNIFNVLFILGISAMIAPIAVQRSTTLKEIPLSLLAALVLFAMANDVMLDGAAGSILTHIDGIVFLAFFILFLVYTVGLRQAEGTEESQHKQRTVLLSVGMVFIGLVSLVIGGKLTVDAAVTVARTLGVSEALIGLTIVAAGTSLPELATSTVAAYRGNADIAVGNIVGSNIFNIFLILGVSALIRPIPFSPASNFDILVLIITTLLLFIIVHNGLPHSRLLLWWKQKNNYIIRRWEGAVMLASYIVYIGYISYRG